MPELPLYPIRRDRLAVMTGELGIWQHASETAPDPRFGYCTDDVARALQVDLLHAREIGWTAVSGSAWRSLRFLIDAFDADAGRFRNFRGSDGSWQAEPGSEDCQGRALVALASAIDMDDMDGMDGDAAFARDALAAFAAALPVARRVHALRAVSSALIGCDVALRGDALSPDLRAATLATFEWLAARLSTAFAGVDVASDWPWPEPVLTYENALPARALLVAARRLDNAALRQTSRSVLDWLVHVQTTSDGTFSPIGSNGWWRRGEARSRFDQQPIEAASTAIACEAALGEFGDARDLATIEAAYGWFLGRNDLGIAVAAVANGACHDGLTPDGVNLNQGAESTLMWQSTLECVRRVRRTRDSGSARPLPRTPALAGSRR